MIPMLVYVMHFGREDLDHWEVKPVNTGAAIPAGNPAAMAARISDAAAAAAIREAGPIPSIRIARPA